MLFGPKSQAGTICPFLPPFPVVDPASGQLKAFQYQTCLKETCYLYRGGSCVFTRLASGLRDGSAPIQDGSASVQDGSATASGPAPTTGSAEGNA